MCESYSGPAKSVPIKRLAQLNSDPIKRNRLYIYTYIHNTYVHINRVLMETSALRACLRCATGEHFASAGGSLRSPGVTLVNYKGDTSLNMSILLC